MLKRLLSVAVAAAVMMQGFAAAAEPAPGTDVLTVPDRAALAVHIDALEAGDRVVVATEEGVIAGELIDKDAVDIVIDQPLVQGGAERIAIPRADVRGLRYQSRPSQAHATVKGLVITAIVIGFVYLALRHFVPTGP